MDYSKHYAALITRAQTRDRIDGFYYEKHHILPRCLGGSDEADNLVILTPEEHFVAHQLLVKNYPMSEGLAFACLKMCGNPHGQRSNKAYGWLRRRHSIATKKRLIGNKHAANRKQTPEEKKRRSDSLKEYYKNNPRTDEARHNLSVSLKNSDKLKAVRIRYSEKMKICREEKQKILESIPKKVKVPWNKGLSGDPRVKGNTKPNSKEAYAKMWETRKQKQQLLQIQNAETT